MKTRKEWKIESEMKLDDALEEAICFWKNELIVYTSFWIGIGVIVGLIIGYLSFV